MLLHIPIILQENGILINKTYPTLWNICLLIILYLFFGKHGVLNFQYKFIHYLAIIPLFFMSKLLKYKLYKQFGLMTLFVTIHYIQTVYNPI